jgi:hypothetical protein
MRFPAFLLTSLTALLAACGSTVPPDGSGGSGGSTPSVCPASQPAEGSSCSDESLACEYEDGPIVVCRAAMLCEDGAWVSEAPGCSAIPDSTGCPATQPAPGSCLNDGSVCIYEGGRQCGCNAIWHCMNAPGGGCPEEAPHYGQPCAQEGLECSYGLCSIGTQAQRNCKGGVWKDVPVPCPE